MKPCWRDRGLTEDGAAYADRILEAMIGLVANAGPEVAQIVLFEALDHGRVGRADALDRARRAPGRTA